MQIAQFFPNEGEILDMGSGHGLLTFALLQAKPNTVIIGCDHDKERVDYSRKILGAFARAQMKHGNFTLLSGARKESISGISIIDVLHYFDFAEQETYLKNAWDALSIGGLLIFREVNTQTSVSIINSSYEKIATQIGFTKGQNLNFRTVVEWENLARSIGFQVESYPLTTFPFSDHLFLCKKPEKSA